MSIHFIQAGGTIDKYYPRNQDNHGYNFAVGKPAFFEILCRAGYDMAITHSIASQKDSLEHTDEDRRTISIQVRDAPAHRIIITHGTDTIYQTAEAIAALAGASKVVILTGAMTPAEMRQSDADFNLGMAVAAVQILPPGIYIALGAKVVLWHDYVPS